MGRILGYLTCCLLAGLCVGTLTLQDGWAQELAGADQRSGLRNDSDAAPGDAHGIRFSERRAERAGPQYRAGPVRTWFLGDEYRSVWVDDVEMPVLDMGRTAGGLTVTGSAGGLQTTLLFLEGADGRHFILRKIEKEAGGALPEGARRTVVEDIAQDQVSSLNPYAAFVIPTLAEAAGVLYTSPSLVLVPDDPRLGEHRNEFAGEPALLERKVDEDVSNVARFGYPEEVIGYEEMLERVEADASARVDQRAFLRSRLFDMLLGDRDRHDGQYFWAVTERGTRYVPLPIDRDFAFARFDGLLNRVGRFTGKIELRKLTYFGSEIDNLVGLNYQAAKLDIRFSSELTRDDWIQTAQDLQEDLTDAVIEEAIEGWPPPVYDAVGRETIETLKARRAELVDAADEYYTLLTQKVDVVATDEAERIRVDRSEDGHTEISIESIRSGQRWFSRRFLRTETDEVRLFGLGGDDEFVVTGGAPGRPLVFVVGGRGRDVVRSPSGRRIEDLIFYDTELDAEGRRRAAFREVHEPSDLDYTAHRYEFDRFSPLVSVDYDSDEGIYLGGGGKMTRHGFRKDPYAARHAVSANYAPRSRAFNVQYDGRIIDVLAGWDGLWEADVLEEEEFNDFYGLGNETSGSESNRAQFLARFRWVRAFPAFARDLGSNVFVTVGPYFEYADIEAPSGFSEENPTRGFTPDQMNDKYFAGLRSRFEVDGRDTTFMTESGLRWLAEVGYHAGIRHGDERFARFGAELSYFYTPPLPGRVTLAFRVGGATNVGDFAFFQANTVGGRENLRGFRKTRYSGRTSAFGNAEIRLKLMDLNIYLTRGELGATGFYDVGRVWVDDENSRLWHHGYGAGLWYTPFYRFIVNGRVGFSTEGSLTRVSFGMFF